MQAASRSVATRFLSACAAMQMRTRAEAPLAARKQDGGRRQTGASDRQLRLRIHFVLESVSVALMQQPSSSSSSSSSAAAVPPLPPLFSIQFGTLSLSLEYRLRDLTISVRLQRLTSSLLIVPKDTTTTTTSSSSSSRPREVPILHFVPASSNTDAAASLQLIITSEGSPTYHEVQAKAVLHLILGSGELHLCSTTLETGGALVLRLQSSLHKAIAAAQLAHPDPPSEVAAAEAAAERRRSA